MIWVLNGALTGLVLCLIAAVVTLWQNLERAVERIAKLERVPDPRSWPPIPCALCGARFAPDQRATLLADGRWICVRHHGPLDEQQKLGYMATLAEVQRAGPMAGRVVSPPPRHMDEQP